LTFYSTTTGPPIKGLVLYDVKACGTSKVHETNPFDCTNDRNIL